jgi:diguanylate cyclase (GGDEF)-like protein
MPTLSGAELCRRVRSSAPENYVHFVFATGFDDRAHFLAGMGAGADDYLTKPIDLDRLAARLEAVHRLVRQNRELMRQNSALRRDSQRFFHASRVDQLTGIGNRQAMQEALDVAGAAAERYGHAYSIGFCDIDHFKAYNDHFGHLAGDGVLKRVAGAIGAELRHGDAVFRFGGEEFLVLLVGQRVATAKVAMERVRRAVERLEIPTHPSGIVTVSVGVAERATASGGAATQQDWLGRADEALYAAKQHGRNRVVAA